MSEFTRSEYRIRDYINMTSSEHNSSEFVQDRVYDQNLGGESGVLITTNQKIIEDKLESNLSVAVSYH